jgi:acetyl-CoA acyltransferase
MKEAVVVTTLRTAVGKAKRGTLKDTRPDDMAAAVIRAAVERTEGLQPEDVDDVIIGCAFPEAEQGMNMGRIAALRAGLPVGVPGMTINRFCSSGLQSIAFAVDRIRTGGAEVILAGGSETMSLVPMGGKGFSANPYLAEHFPAAYINMGLTAENVAERYGITRAMQDEFSYRSHMNAINAIQNGYFKNEIVPLEVEQTFRNNGKFETKTVTFDTDEGPRADTTMEALANLKPVFKQGGSVTAGNSSQMSDGAAISVIMSKQKARRAGVKPLARLIAYAVGAVHPDEMGIGPVEAIPKALKLAKLGLKDIDIIELNEAFAAQAVAVIQKANLDPDKVNVNGGAVALGHPLGCSGAKLTATALHELIRRDGTFAMVTMCVGGGMGAAGIFERLY